MLKISFLILCFTLFFGTAAGAAKIPEPAKTRIEDLPPLSTLDRELAKDPLLSELKFRINLDLIAPLGDGAKNSAEYFKEFLDGTGSRSNDADAAEDRAIAFKLGSDEMKVLQVDDPFVVLDGT